MITSEQSELCLEYVRKSVGGILLREKSLLDIGLIKQVLNTLRSLGVKIPSDEEFLEFQTTAIGSMLYLPEGLDPEKRILAGVHGFEHVWQFQNGEYEGDAGIPDGLAMAFLYFSNGQARARLEQRANRAAWEVAHLGLKKKLPTIDEVCGVFEAGYFLSDDDKKLSKELAAQWLTEVRYGIVDTAAGRACLEKLGSPEAL